MLHTHGPSNEEIDANVRMIKALFTDLYFLKDQYS